MWLRQSTASQEVLLGPFLDSTDGNTAETALTIANTDIKLWKEGATTEADKTSGGATHIASGRYYAVLDATDTNTLGKLEINVHVAGALAVRREFMVLPAMIYDSIVLGTDRLDTNVTHVADTAQTANDNGADINTLLTRIVGTLATGTHNPASTAQLGALTDWIDGGRLDLLLDAIKAVTDAQAATGTGLTAIPWNAAWDAEVQSEVQDAIEANHLDHLLAADYDPAAKPGVATALLNEMVESDAGVSRFTVNALENAPSGSGASAAAIADAVWDELQADHVAAGSFGLVASEVADILVDTAEIGAAGAGLTALATAAALATVDINVDAILVDTAEIGAAGAGLAAVPWNAAWDAEVQSEVADALTAYDPPTNTEMASAFTEIKGATWSSLTDTLEHIRNKQTDIETDTQDLQTQVGTAGAGLTDLGGMSTTMTAQVNAEADTAITDAALATAANLATVDTNVDNLNLGIIYGAAATGTLSTTQATSNLTGYADDQLIGRVIIWTSGACEGEGTEISDYASASGLLTFTALTTAPGNGDTFKIV